MKYVNNSFDNYGGDIEKLFTEIKQIQALRTFNNNYTNKNIIIDDIQLAYSKLFSTNKKSTIPLYMYS